MNASPLVCPPSPTLTSSDLKSDLENLPNSLFVHYGIGDSADEVVLPETINVCPVDGQLHAIMVFSQVCDNDDLSWKEAHLLAVLVRRHLQDLDDLRRPVVVTERRPLSHLRASA